jgi:ADP-ribosylglycohydrolase
MKSTKKRRKHVGFIDALVKLDNEGNMKAKERESLRHSFYTLSQRHNSNSNIVIATASGDQSDSIASSVRGALAGMGWRCKSCPSRLVGK